MTQPTSAVPPAHIPPAPIQPVAPAKRPKKAPAESNVKETLEQILVAFILAFIFRCFIVEAYVIPTGSMAPTLLGAHMDFRCPDCGWHWAVNYSGENNGETVPNTANESYPIRCPNCGYKVPRELAGEPDNDATNPPVAYGDRILVQKYIYLLHEPRRWDVVVFKTPDNPISSREEAQVEPYTQNYIKRLVGTPGETIMVLDGDVYVAQGKPDLADYTPDDFKIQHKPYKVQEAMWRIVYDNDHLPRGLPRTYMLPGNQYTGEARPEIVDYPFEQPWKPIGIGWDTTTRRFKFDGISASQLTFDPRVVPEKHALTDWVGYDVSHASPKNVKDGFLERGYDVPNDSNLDDLNRRGFRSYVPTRTGPNTISYSLTRVGSRTDPLFDVSDVKLMFTYVRESGEGPLRANITKHRNLFSLEITPTKIALNLFAAGAQTPREIGSIPISDSTRPMRVEFAVVDYRASVRIDGSEVIASTPDQFSPNVAQLLKDYDENVRQPKATITLEAVGQKSEVSHLSLWRDVYYLNQDTRQTLRWAIPKNFPNGTVSSKLMQLGQDEFFVMGDNSMLSSDARVWSSRVSLPYEDVNVDGGRVPRRFMLGRAFFVYWPAGYAPVNGFPVRMVPNFGEMRFIH